MNYTTWIEISKSALKHNVDQYRSWIPNSTKIAAVLKANAYGHGLIEVAQLHEQNPDVARLCVADSQEAVLMRQQGITKPILVLGFINTDIDLIAKHAIDITVSDIQTIKDLNAAAMAQGVIINLHLKIDTGLSRLGFLPQDVQQAIALIQQLPAVRLQGICSHFIEASNKELVHAQEDMLKPFWQSGVQIHTAISNSAFHVQYEYDFVRLGAGLYGYLPEADEKLQELLQPILSIKTRVIGLKQTPEGVSVGYGKTTYVTSRPTTVAILGMGYWDGLDPDLSNFGKVIIHDQFAPIIGRVNMNYCMVDVTDIADVKIGDIAIVLGQSQTKKITGYDWRIGAKRNVRIFLSRIRCNLPRIIVD